MSYPSILYVLKILSEESDRENGITVRGIKDKLSDTYPEVSLSDYQIRSALFDIETFCDENNTGVIFEKHAGAHNQSYYKIYRSKFGLNEARLLFDSVSINRFLSNEQKQDLLSQMEGFLSIREVRHLKQRVQARPCLMDNRGLVTQLNLLYAAIEQHKCVRFDYMKYKLDGKQELAGKYRHIRPIRVIWEQEHYYIFAINPEHQLENWERTYRIDRMRNLQLDCGEWIQTDKDNMEYPQFEMMHSTGREQVTLRVHRDLIDLAVETLGPQLMIRPDYQIKGWARIHAVMDISEGFYRWVLRQSGKIEVLSPPNIRQNVKQRLIEMLNSYS